MRVSNDLLKRALGNPAMISRGAMLAEMQRMDHFVQYLFVELYCAKPNHEYFVNFTDTELDGLRIEQKRRVESEKAIRKEQRFSTRLIRKIQSIFQNGDSPICPQ